MGARLDVMIATFAVGLMAAAAAHAADLCRGPKPGPGASIRGPVLVIADGSSLCLGQSGPPSGWVRVPLARVRANQAALMAAAFGKNATCVINSTGEGECVIEGEPLASILRKPEIAQSSGVWR